MKKIIILGSILILISACTKKQVHENVIFPDIVLTDYTGRSVLASDIFPGSSAVKLETTEESVFGGNMTKVLKRNGKYYIQANEKIFVFDSDGEFVGKLSALGNGPEEYPGIFDFDVVSEKDEIWISSDRGIYVYSTPEFQWKRIIPLDFYASRFKYLNDSTVIAATNDSIEFKIFNTDGLVRSQFFEADQALSARKLVQFMAVGNKIVHQFENSNTAVVYDIPTETFTIGELFSSSDNLSDAQICRDYLDEYGYFNFTMKLMENYVSISTFRKLNDMALVTLITPQRKMQLVVNDGNKSRTYTFYPQGDADLENNLVQDAEPRSFITLTACDSDDSFLFIVDSSDIENEDNPTLLNIYSVDI